MFAALQDVKSTQLCMIVQPNQLVDPVLSLSNVLQKAMHVRCQTACCCFTRCQEHSTLHGRAAKSAGWSCLESQQCASESHACKMSSSCCCFFTRCRRTAKSAGWSCLESQQCASESHACKISSSCCCFFTRCQEHSTLHGFAAKSAGWSCLESQQCVGTILADVSNAKVK